MEYACNSGYSRKMVLRNGFCTAFSHSETGSRLRLKTAPPSDSLNPDLIRKYLYSLMVESGVAGSASILKVFFISDGAVHTAFCGAGKNRGASAAEAEYARRRDMQIAHSKQAATI